MSFDAARRAIASIVIAVATSTGLYLVGSVYTSAYYGRMSIEVTALDLAPPFIALQAVHVVQSLLEYPVALALIYLLFRFIATYLPSARVWSERVRQRFGRLALLIVNGLIIAPLVIATVIVTFDEEVVLTSEVLSDVDGAMTIIGLALVIYVLWLSLARREFLLTQIRERKLLPIGLLFTLYLLDALVATANDAALDAELLMTGKADSSTAVTFTMASGVSALPSADLLLVTIRNGHYFVVERQPYPPSPRPIAYAVPVRAVDAVRMERINEATVRVDELVHGPFATPAAR